MRRNRGELALGLILILLGAWFVAERQMPDLATWRNMFTSGPLAVVAVGAAIFVIGLLFGNYGMAVPAAVVAGIGGIIYYTTVQEDASAWSYLWTLIPGFVGVGSIVEGALARKKRKALSGLNLIFVSAVLFAIFGAMMGKLTILGPYGPSILLIVLGIWVIGRGLLRKGGYDETR